MAGVDLPVRAIREQIASAVDLIVHQARLKDGTRKITNITEVQGMEGDVIVMQDVFVFEQTGVVEGKIQGRLKPTGIRPKFVEKFEAGHPPAARPVRLQLLGGWEGDRPMESTTLLIAGIAAVAIVADRGRHRDVRERLGHQRAPRALRTAKPEAAGRRQPASSGLAGPSQSSQALTQLNKVVEQRDFGANLARELARADLRLKPSEYLAIWAAARSASRP